MYYSQFGLSTAPFQLTPSRGAPFLGTTHREALATLEWGLSDPNGFALLIGEPGTGKTSLILTLMETEHPGVRIIHVNRPIAFKEIVQLIASEAGIAGYNEPSAEFMRLFLERMDHRKLRVVLIIDEAQGLADETLESLRLLADGDGDGRFALQMILVGQPDLLKRLKRSQLRALDQRISTRAILKHLERGEVHEYIDHRLQICGSTAERLFSPAAMRALAQCGLHIPREINLLCHNSLILAYAAERHRVEASMVRSAAADYYVSGQSVSVARLDGLLYQLRNISIFNRRRLLTAMVLVGAALSVSAAAYLRRTPPIRFAKEDVSSTTSFDVLTNQNPSEQIVRVDRAEPSRVLRFITPTTIGAPMRSHFVSRSSSDVNAADTSSPEADSSSNASHSDVNSLRTIVIEAGDNLSSIAEEFLGSKDPEAIGKLMAANPQIPNSNLIHPGEIVHLPRESN